MKMPVTHRTLFLVLVIGFLWNISSGVITAQTYYNGLPVITRSFDEMADDSIFVPLSPGSKMMYLWYNSRQMSEYSIDYFEYSQMYEGKLYVGTTASKLYHYDSLTHVYTSLKTDSMIVDTVMDFKTPAGVQFRDKMCYRGITTLFSKPRKTFYWVWDPYPGPHNPPRQYHYAAGIGYYYYFANEMYGGGSNAEEIVQALYNRGDHYEFYTLGKPVVWVNPPVYIHDNRLTIPVKVDNACNAPDLCLDFSYGIKHFTKKILWQGFYANQTDTLRKNDIRLYLPCNSTTTQTNIYLDTAKMRTHDYYFRISATDSGLIPQTTLSPDTGYYRIQYIPPVGIDCEDEMPLELLVAQNYPNPFNPVTTVAFTLPEQQLVTIIVYDLLGREVLRPLHSVMHAGSHMISIDASSLAAGTYFYAVRAGDASAVRKMILLK